MRQHAADAGGGNDLPRNVGACKLVRRANSVAEVELESDLRDRIEGRLRERGSLVYRVNDVYQVGLPDTNILHDGVPVYAEFKSERRKLDVAQKLWLRNLAAHGGIAIEVRSSPKGKKPWLAKYRQMGPKGEWLFDYIEVDCDQWLERLIIK